MSESEQLVSSLRTCRAASLLWILSAQCLAVQFVVQSAWTTPFSLDFNTISDLGAIQCQDARPGPHPFVCSPWHGVMDASFVVFGLMWALGSLLLRRAKQFPFESKMVTVPLIAAGLGAILVGLFPEDGVGILHGSGATIEMFGGMIGFIAIGLRLSKRGSYPMGMVSTALGVLSFIGFAIFLLTYQNGSSFLGLRLGGWERVAYWSENLWLVVAGIWLLRNNTVEQNRKAS